MDHYILIKGLKKFARPFRPEHASASCTFFFLNQVNHFCIDTGIFIYLDKKLIRKTGSAAHDKF
jgi:hypothetical protein